VRSAARPAPAQRLAQPALLLRRFPFGESSLVLHLLTPGAGRVALLAKGAYRPSSGFFAVFDLFDTLAVRWSARPGQELGLVTRATLATRRPDVARDLERYRAGLGLLELAHLTAREHHEERALFGWLEGGLGLLQAGRAAPALVGAASDLKLLRENGLAPALGACASCGAAPAVRASAAPVSVALGGRLCTRCAAEVSARGGALASVPLNVLRVAETLMSATPAMLEHTRIEAGLLERVRAFVGRFLEYHLETRLRSRRGAPSPTPR
jgi:DNA repair protein RecO (recombination protein O)